MRCRRRNSGRLSESPNAHTLSMTSHFHCTVGFVSILVEGNLRIMLQQLPWTQVDDKLRWLPLKPICIRTLLPRFHWHTLPLGLETNRHSNQPIELYIERKVNRLILLFARWNAKDIDLYLRTRVNKQTTKFLWVGRQGIIMYLHERNGVKYI